MEFHRQRYGGTTLLVVEQVWFSHSKSKNEESRFKFTSSKCLCLSSSSRAAGLGTESPTRRQEVVSPLHPRLAGLGTESPTRRHEEGKYQCHSLKLLPQSSSTASPFSKSVTSSGCPWSPGGKDNPSSPGKRSKKGKLLGRGTFCHVYVGFNK